MSNELITKDNKRIITLFKTMDRILGQIENSFGSRSSCLGGEQYLTDLEVSKRLQITRRTLHNYRTYGKISYIQLPGKILYKESDIQKMLEDNYRKK